ncbi:MAG: hypothetical protein K2Q20_01190 [Phycisphaerales bacterium]|nr:hypothetical protein [Phycisphaerales bacterium]
MVRLTSRPYSKQELDDYDDQMGGVIASIPSCLFLAMLTGGVIAVAAFGVRQFVAWLASGAATWTWPLVVGAIVAAIAFTLLRLWFRGEDWRVCPPTLATDVAGTIDAAWDIDDDSPYSRLLLRIEPDLFLLVTQGLGRPPFGGEEQPGEEIGSQITAVLLGERRWRRVIRSTVLGPCIPVTKIETYPWADDNVANLEYTNVIPDALYTFEQLPRWIREAVRPS